ncbi:MAG TPA: hypothetical protein VHO70_23730 [Chitinispirillaceae bacterium]|nr:hypothetical protein [Chitinispirillaceae bacterium]
MNSWINQLSLVAFCAAAIVFSNFLLKLLLKTPVVNFFCDKPDARKVHSKPIPRLGGTIIVFTFFNFHDSTSRVQKYG